jgi:hypothetical protein
MIFPGHYAGRATHIHVMARENVNSHPDNAAHEDRVSGNEWESNVRHIGQVYFDESLREEVEKLAPYNSNSQQNIQNDQDLLAGDQASPDYDPFVNFVYLNGRNVSGT